MKKYAGTRPLTGLMAKAKKDKWEIDTHGFDKGDDCIWIRDMEVRFKQILFNVVTGWLWIYSPESEDAIATHMSVEFDGVDWYEEVMDLVYLPAVGIN